jgi:hypothetical protein
MSIVKQAGVIVERAQLEERAQRVLQASQELGPPIDARYSTAGEVCPTQVNRISFGI